MKNFLMCTALGLGGVAILTSPALAQVPGSADAGRAQDRLEDRAVLPDVGQAVEIEDPILQDVPANAENIKFTLTSISLEGVNAYNDNQIGYLYENKLGTTISLEDVYAIAASLTRKYRNEGYILTQVVVPPQTIEGGQVRLRVVEGFVDKIVIEGANTSEEAELIRSYADRIRTGGAVNIRNLEKYLLLINDLPGVTARSILSPSRATTGASDLRIIVSRDYYEALLGVDNYGSRYLGPVQFTAAGSLNSLLGYNEQITGQFVAATDIDEYELAYGSLSYEMPIFSYGTILRTFLSHSDTEPGYTLESLNVHGRSTAMGVGVEHPFIRSRSQNLSGRLQLDWRKAESSSDVLASTEDNIRALRIGGRYEFLDTMIGVGINSIDVEFSRGLDVLGASNAGDSNLTRSAADGSDFKKVNAEVQRLQRVTSDVNLLLAARGQLSNAALLSSEEFGVGGINYGRGYEPSEIVGEDGYATKAELQWNQPFAWNLVEDYQIYGFYDFGKVWNDDATTSDDDESLASAGAGLRADFPNAFQAGAGIAFPLTRDVETQNDTDPRFYFNLYKSF